MTTTNGNGHAPSVERLREQAAIETAQADLAEARHRRELWESVGSFRYPDDWANPYGFRRDDFGNRWHPIGMGGGTTPTRDGRNQPFVQTDGDLDSMRAMAHWLTTKNDHAIGVLQTAVDLTVKQGYEWEARPQKGYEDDGRANDLARQVQRVIDRDADLNKLPMRERSSCVRAPRDGDVGLRHFRQSDGTTRHRFVRAEQIRDPGDLGPLASFGVETDPDDVEDVLFYHVTYDGGMSYQRVPADELSFYKRNVDMEVKRGLSDFFSGGDTFDGVAKLLSAMRKGATLMAKIAWIEKVSGATNAQIQAHASGLKSLTHPVVEDPRTGRRMDAEYMADGTVVRTKDNKDYESGPLAGNTNNFITVADSCLRSAGVRWGLPPSFVSGDTSSNNLPGILGAGSPLVNRVECAQRDFGEFFLRWRWVAIKNACRAGVIRAGFEEVQALVDLHYTAPQVAITDPVQQAQVDHMDMDKKVMSKQTRAARRGLDWEQEKKNLAEEPPEQAQGGGPGGSPAPEPPPAFGESHAREALWLDANGWLLEAAGQKREKGVPFQGPSGRWFVVNDRGRTVPAKNPQAGKEAPKKAAKPKPDKAKATAALDAVAGGEASPEHLRELADHLGGMTVPELRAARQKLAASFGGASRKEAMVKALRDHVQGLMSAPEEDGAIDLGAPDERPAPAAKKEPPAPATDPIDAVAKAYDDAGGSNNRARADAAVMKVMAELPPAERERVLDHYGISTDLSDPYNNVGDRIAAATLRGQAGEPRPPRGAAPKKAAPAAKFTPGLPAGAKQVAETDGLIVADVPDPKSFAGKSRHTVIDPAHAKAMGAKVADSITPWLTQQLPHLDTLSVTTDGLADVIKRKHREATGEELSHGDAMHAVQALADAGLVQLHPLNEVRSIPEKDANRSLWRKGALMHFAMAPQRAARDPDWAKAGLAKLKGGA